jgi:hypothetical protein
MEYEDGDYMIIVKPKNIKLVRAILDKELGTNNYVQEYKPEFATYSIDFNIKGKKLQK